MGSTSQMEWAANPQMVSSHKTEILILFVIVDIFIVTNFTEEVVDRHRLTTSLKLNKYFMNFIPVISLPISAAKVRQINKVHNT